MIESLETRLHFASQAYNWQNAPFGGGGFVTGIVFSPTVPNLVYARTDVGGAYRWDQSLGRWTPLTDWVPYNDPSATGGVGNEALAIDPSDSNRLYTTLGLYTASWAGNAAILRSTDRGQTWQRTNVPFKMGGNEDGRSNGERLMVDPNSNNILFLATPRNGLWKSTDYGATWNQVTSFPVTTTANGVGPNCVQFIKGSGTAGSATPTIYVGASQTVNNLYRSTDGGATWQNVSNPSLDPTYMPARSAQDGIGNMYITYGVAAGPNGVDISSGARAGAVWKLALATGTWTDVTPNTNGQGGFSGVSVDAQHPGTVVISTMDRWWPNDDVYRSTNGGSTWTSLRNTDITPWAWTDKIKWDAGKGNFNWAGDLEIDPFDSDHALVTTGGGINSTFDLTAADTGAATHWNTFVNGLEETAQIALVSPPSGAPLITAAGDVGGSRFADLTTPSSQYSVLPETSRDIDFAESNPNLLVRAGDPSPNIVYSRDNAVTWTAFPSLPANIGTGTGSMDNAGRLAMSADGNTVVWDPGDDSTNNLKFPLSISTWNGSAWSSWTTSTWSGSADVKPVSDRLNANDFYILDGAKLYLSTDRGASWTLKSSSAPSGTLEASFVASGDLWVGAYGNGLWHSTNFGTTWTHIASSTVTYVNSVGFGKAATGQSYPALYMVGSANSTTGMFRSDDGGTTWLTISDSQHQWNGAIVGDRNIYGRVYLGAGGRGIIYGDIQSTAPSVATAAAATAVTGNTTTSNLSVMGADDGGESSLTYTWRVTNKPPGSTVPTFSVNGTNASKTTTANFFQSGYYSFQVAITDAQGHVMISSVGLTVSITIGAFTGGLDIGGPSPAGSSAYNTGTSTYTVAGGGSDIWNTSDQFQFLSESFSGDGALVARVTSVQNTNTWAKAGVMFRDSSAAGAMFADMLVTPSSGVSFQWRNSTGGNPGDVQITGVAAPAWVKLVRTGNSFTAFYSKTIATPTASDWIQVGTAQTIGMNSSAQIGLAVTSHNNGTLCTSTFTNVSIITDLTPPTLSIGTFNYKTSQSLSFTFSEDVLASLSAGDFVVTNTDTNAVIPAGDFTFGATGGSGVQSVATLTHKASAGILPDGHYSVAINKVSDAAGNAMLTTNWPFFVLTGDANHDGHVDAADFTALSQNFNSASATYDKGDFNYDGTVNALDFNALSAHFGAASATVVPSEPVPATAMSATSSVPTLFSANPVASDSSDDLLDTLNGHDSVLDLE